MKNAIKLIIYLSLLIIMIPSLFLGILGLNGTLADVSESENRQFGIMYLVIGFILPLIGIIITKKDRIKK